MAHEADGLVDQVARDMADASIMAWGSLLGTIVETMLEAEVSEEVVHDFLNRLARSNDVVINEPYRGTFLKMIRVVRESVVLTN